MRASIDLKFARPSREIRARFFFFALGSETFFFAGKFRLGVGVAQFAPYSFPLIFYWKKGMAGMNTWETVEAFRQGPHIHDQSLAEHKDVLHANTWESVV